MTRPRRRRGRLALLLLGMGGSLVAAFGAYRARALDRAAEEFQAKYGPDTIDG